MQEESGPILYHLLPFMRIGALIQKTMNASPVQYMQVSLMREAIGMIPVFRYMTPLSMIMCPLKTVPLKSMTEPYIQIQPMSCLISMLRMTVEQSPECSSVITGVTGMMHNPLIRRLSGIWKTKPVLINRSMQCSSMWLEMRRYAQAISRSIKIRLKDRLLSTMVMSAQIRVM